jgi:hypothetical protein
MDTNQVVGTHDILFATLDSLRYDVAQELHAAGRTPHLSARLPATGWERRHSPGNFTFAVHAAFFAGFLPTPASPAPHPRPFAARFAGSETTTADTHVFDAPDIVAGFRQAGYHTICVGDVGFFNKLTPLVPSCRHSSTKVTGPPLSASPTRTRRRIRSYSPSSAFV